jgi:HEAT repeat protein
MKLYSPSVWAFLILLSAFTLQGCCNESELPNAQRGLYSPDTREQTRALQALARCGDKADSSVQRIVALMYDKNVGVASAAAYALRKIDTKQAREALHQAESIRERKRR